MTPTAGDIGRFLFSFPQSTKGSKNSGGPDSVGINWVHKLLKRHPEIHTKLRVKIDAQRLRNTILEALEAWFEKFREVQTEHQVENADS